MSWWEKVLETIEVGDELFTPGRGTEGKGRRPFWVKEKEEDALVIKSGNSRILIERKCFDVIEEALEGNLFSQLRVASLRANHALEGSADKVIREKTGSVIARGN